MELQQIGPKAIPTAHDASTDRNPAMAKPADHRDDGLPAYKPQNYHRLAEIMSMDRNFAIFRRFEDLNMLHLMALQAELLELRELFRDQCRRDDESNPGSGGPHLLYSSYFHALRESEAGEPPSLGTPNTRYRSSQLGLMTTLRKRMAEYSTLEDSATSSPPNMADSSHQMLCSFKVGSLEPLPQPNP